MRGQIIVRTSLVGIVVNILLAAFKAAVGLTANSIAVLLDAVNNLSDALSSVITVAGAKLAGRKPDKEHPFGHGRIEYLSAMIIAAIVFYAGLTSLWESGKKIIEPEAADYSMLSLVIIAVAVVVKIVLGRYFKQQGRAAESGALEASGADALFDAILSFSVLVSALIYLGTGVSLEAYVGVIIAGFIIKSGIDMMRETLNDILGERPDPTLVRKIKGMLAREPEIRGAYDLMMNNYGPGRNYASVHIELPDTMTVEEADRLTRRIHEKSSRPPACASWASASTPTTPKTPEPSPSARPSTRSSWPIPTPCRSTASTSTARRKRCASTSSCASATTSRPSSKNSTKKSRPPIPTTTSSSTPTWTSPPSAKAATHDEMITVIAKWNGAAIPFWSA